ncbi:MAG: glucosamine-6-phosphate deaminase [bacterium]
MNISIETNKNAVGKRSAEQASAYIVQAIEKKGMASIIVATGASQFEFLQHLTADVRINWSNVTVFHLDEYVGIPVTHIASFRRYLRERFVQQLPCPLAAFHEVNASSHPIEECERLSALISKQEIDVCCMGIGENGHIAFNDPPADFETDKPYLVVELDEGCRQQQVNEGWFPTLADVPKQAISMSVKQILKSKALINSVPGERKAVAVKNALEGEITPLCPASILRTHPDCHLNLDTDSARLLKS